MSAQRALDLTAVFPRPIDLHAALHPAGGGGGGLASQKAAEELIQTGNVNKKIASKLYTIFTSLNPDENVTT